MMKEEDCEVAISILQHQISKLCSWGLLSAAIIRTREGSLRTFGSQYILNMLDRNKTEINDESSEQQTSDDASASQDIDLPTIDFSLNDLNFHDTRHLALMVIKAGRGGRNVGWGKAEHKPDWWPSDLPWTTRGVQSGVNRHQLQEVIKAGYAFYGIPIKEEESSDSDDINTHEVESTFSDNANLTINKRLVELGCIKIQNGDDQSDDSEVQINPKHCKHEEKKEKVTKHLKNKQEKTPRRQKSAKKTSISKSDSPKPSCSPKENNPPHEGSTMSSPEHAEDESSPSAANEKPVIQVEYAHNIQSGRRLAVKIMRATQGSPRFIGWGKPECMPKWWPKSIPWTTRGVQAGVNFRQLQTIISAYYHSHGVNYDVIEEKENLNNKDDESNKSETSNSETEDDDGDDDDGDEEEEDEEEKEIEIVDNSPKQCTSFARKKSQSSPLQVSPQMNPEKRDSIAELKQTPRQNTFKSTRQLATDVVRADKGSRKIGWGKPDCMPLWWPREVPWTVRGVQSGINYQQLHDVINACYRFYGILPGDEERSRKGQGQNTKKKKKNSKKDSSGSYITPESTLKNSISKTDLTTPKLPKRKFSSTTDLLDRPKRIRKFPKVIYTP